MQNWDKRNKDSTKEPYLYLGKKSEYQIAATKLRHSSHNFTIRQRKKKHTQSQLLIYLTGCDYINGVKIWKNILLSNGALINMTETSFFQKVPSA